MDRGPAPLPVFLTLALFAAPAQCGAAAVRAVERLLALHQPGVTSGFTASPDARRLAWLEQADARQRVMLDGRPIASYPQVSGLVFSADGEHLAYAARVEGGAAPDTEWTVVLDGREYGRYDAVGRPVLDRDASLLGFTAQERYGPPTAVVNGVRQADRDTVLANSVVVSREGERHAFVTRSGDRFRVVADGRDGNWFDHIAQSSLHFSPGGARLGYLAGHPNLFFVLDNRAVGPLAQFSIAYDSADAGFAHAAFDGRAWRLVAQYTGRSIDRELDAVPLGLLLSPDGRHLAATLRKPLGTTIITLDDSIVAEHDAVKALCFSADGKGLAWAAQVKGGWRVIVDGAASPRYGNIWSLALGPDARHYACVVRSGRGYSVVADGTVVGRYDDLLVQPLFASAREFRFIARRRGRYLLVGVAIPAGPGN